MTRVFVLAAALLTAVPPPSFALGLLADDAPAPCGCGCGRDAGLCCCVAARGTDLAMRCRGDAEDAEAQSAVWPPAVARSSDPFTAPASALRPDGCEPSRRFIVDLERDPPVPRAPLPPRGRS